MAKVFAIFNNMNDITNCIKNISVDNFRGIQHLEIDGFSKINLIAGKNNVGKSTILEALFLLIGMSNPELPNVVNTFRLRSNIANWDHLRYLFYNMDLDSKIQLTGVVKNENRSVDISLQNLYNAYGQSNSSTKMQNFDSIKLTFMRDGFPSQMSSVLSIFPDGRMNRQIDPVYMENTLARFIPASHENDLGVEFSQFLKNQKNGNRDVLLQILRKFDANISSIDMLNDGLYVGFENVNGLVPLAFAGDGLKLFLNVLISVANSNNDVIFIDEIDNGLHYSSYTLFWKSLIEMERNNKTQLFLTTHNSEMLCALRDVLKENTTYHPLVRFFSVSNFKNEMHAYKYDADEFIAAIDSDVEIRR